jgi:hypothetical protein
MQKLLFNLLLKFQSKQRTDGGYVIVVVMGMVVAMSTMLLTAALTSKVDSNSTRASGNSAGGFYAAEAGLNLRAKNIRSKFVGYNLPSGTSPTNVTSCQGTTSAGTGDFALDTTLNLQDPLNPTDATKRLPVATYILNANKTDSSGNVVPTSVTINPGEQFAGLNAQEYRYDVTSIACDRTNQPTASLAMRFKSRLVPLFQFAAFYDKDLEILPGPNMTLSGPVHTNGDLYLNSDNTITINGQVSTVGSLFRGRKNANSCGGTVRVSNGSGSTPSMNCVGNSRTQITDVSTWNNQIRIGVPRLTVPPPETLDPSPTATYWSKADLRIVLDLNGSTPAIEIHNANNTVDTTRTDKLRTRCPVARTNLRQAVTDSTTVQLRVDSTVGFRVNDKLVIGNDLDNNAIYYDGTAPTGALSPGAPNNPQTSDLPPTLSSSDTLILRQQLGTTPANNTRVRQAVVSTSDTFFNGREGKAIRMLDVDVQKLMDCVYDENLQDSSRPLNDTTEGGLVWYFTVDGPDSNTLVYGAGDKSYNPDNTPYAPPAKQDGNNYGVRLYNGNTLRSTISGAPEIQGLTVVSDQALYVRGHYNCGATSTATSTSLPTCSYKKPAAFLADTINVLSENWRMSDADSQTYNSDNLPTGLSDLSGNRNARNTNINAAFLAGTDTTGGAQEGTTGQSNPYNGGLENYPRFHEDWSPNGVDHTTLRYRGSFVSLGRPRRVDGNWDNGVNYYDPPKRDWDYDTDFNNANLLPPLSPRFVYLRQERFSRSYDRVSFLSMPKTFATMFPKGFVPASIVYNYFRF